MQLISNSQAAPVPSQVTQTADPISTTGIWGAHAVAAADRIVFLVFRFCFVCVILFIYHFFPQFCFFYFSVFCFLSRSTFFSPSPSDLLFYCCTIISSKKVKRFTEHYAAVGNTKGFF
jgi:hypothetical protein